MKQAIFLVYLTLSALSGYAQRSEVHAHQREFDFWVGQWNVCKYGTDSIVGFSQIESINDGTAILENYHTNGKYKGKSLNTYNQKTGNWEQYWTDNGGTILHLTGGIKDGKMVLSQSSVTEAGERIDRITWTPEPNNEVRQSWDVSTDDGATWNRIFDGIYKKR